MVRTKQTACGGSLTRPADMQEATIGDVPEADQDILEDWLDMDNPVRTAAQQATQTTQASKSTGETSEGSKAVGISPTDNPPQSQASTSTSDAQDPTTDPPPQPLAPTNNPPEPQASTSTADTQDSTKNPEEEKDPALIAYVKSYQEGRQGLVKYCGGK